MAENILSDLGVSQKRVRQLSTFVKIEVDPSDLLKVVNNREYMLKRFRKIGFHSVYLDLDGYISGSMDKGLKGNLNE